MNLHVWYTSSSTQIQNSKKKLICGKILKWGGGGNHSILRYKQNNE